MGLLLLRVNSGILFEVKKNWIIKEGYLCEFRGWDDIYKFASFLTWPIFYFLRKLALRSPSRCGLSLYLLLVLFFENITIILWIYLNILIFVLENILNSLPEIILRHIKLKTITQSIVFKNLNTRHQSKNHWYI